MKDMDSDIANENNPWDHTKPELIDLIRGVRGVILSKLIDFKDQGPNYLELQLKKIEEDAKAKRIEIEPGDVYIFKAIQRLGKDHK